MSIPLRRLSPTSTFRICPARIRSRVTLMSASLWQAIPVELTAVLLSVLGPIVTAGHPGSEQRWPARSANARFTSALNSSRPGMSRSRRVNRLWIHQKTRRAVRLSTSEPTASQYDAGIRHAELFRMLKARCSAGLARATGSSSSNPASCWHCAFAIAPAALRLVAALNKFGFDVPD